MKCKTQPVDAKDAYIAGQFDGMKIKPCPRCGKTKPADVHTCTPKEVLKQELKEQSQKTDLNPIGYLLWETGSGWWEFVEEEPVEYYDYKAVYAQPVGNPKKPMDGDAILEGFEATGFSGESFRLRCFNLGVRWAEEYHGIGGEP